jgi:hypothetical protein
MGKVRMLVAGFLVILCGMVPGVAVAQSAPVAARAAQPAKNVCETAGRESAAYRRACMTPGTVLDAARLWYSVPVGVKGRESQGLADRRSVCRYAGEFGGIRPAVRERFFDMAYDSFLRHEAVLRSAGEFARHDCRAMGYRV